jgi:cytochrome P450
VRKLSRPDDAAEPAVELRGSGVEQRWVVRSFAVARQLLRTAEGVSQAGFNAEQVAGAGARMRPPILYLEGQPHRVQRSAAARLFAPAVLENYRPMMADLAETLVAQVRHDAPVDLSRLSMRMAVQVAARVVGLTSSSLDGMGRRLSTFFEIEPDTRRPLPVRLLAALRRSSALLRFYRLDVKPAIRERRRSPRPYGDDVVSQLLDAGFRDRDILTECITYAAAGMVTTAELITATVWHLLDDEVLLAGYRTATREERLALIGEVLRLEPVVGHLYRRTTAPTVLSAPSGDVELPAGARVDLDIRATNADSQVVGTQPLHLRAGRSLPRGVPATLLSFGDGHHRCPGGPLALMETEIFVSRLLQHDLVADAPPLVRWNPVTQGYQLSGLRVRRVDTTA